MSRAERRQALNVPVHLQVCMRCCPDPATNISTCCSAHTSCKTGCTPITLEVYMSGLSGIAVGCMCGISAVILRGDCTWRCPACGGGLTCHQQSGLMQLSCSSATTRRREQGRQGRGSPSAAPTTAWHASSPDPMMLATSLPLRRHATRPGPCCFSHPRLWLLRCWLNVLHQCHRTLECHWYQQSVSMLSGAQLVCRPVWHLREVMQPKGTSRALEMLLQDNRCLPSSPYAAEAPSAQQLMPGCTAHSCPLQTCWLLLRRH